ncbi:UvrD-helicase domain-containing protein [Mycolicibacterium arenosum]|uniref:ATP-binding domain-containing protein n=1 Tax=Mycolicibacterium arenosum TaxID=2952157 RepID=A0ABT1LW31_9MYCO|nr:UvrD-helicase domain-containing protein [Mycolicibacterium sp. CAU 1645]MCP9271105.1 ATP-binding domain-containing protein [Mycolicibacterium sp. CAU 1645]
MLLVATESALKEIVASGATISDMDEKSELHPDLTCLTHNEAIIILHRGDDETSKRIFFAVPQTLIEFGGRVEPAEALVLERLLSFLARLTAKKIVTPPSWNQENHGSYITFYAASRDKIFGSPRWLSEVKTQKDVCLWELFDAGQQIDFKGYSPPNDKYDRITTSWHRLLDRARSQFGPAQSAGPQVEVELSKPRFADVTQDLKFSGWMKRLTHGQRIFVTQSPQHSIKLRGPAGSGKTLTLILKAMNELRRSRESGDSIQILVITHTWALAGEIDEMIARLSEQGEAESITVLPLVAVAQEILPHDLWDDSLEVVGDDSLSGKEAQLEVIEEILDRFCRGDWLTFTETVSDELRARIESADISERRALVWDLMIEFSCVFGADGIFPNTLDAESRYLRLARVPWMMPLSGDQDKRLVLYLYRKFFNEFDAQGKATSDQLVNELLNYFESMVWNRRRTLRGYDEIYVDEFHLFNAQERQMLKYMTRSTMDLPRIFMALDPRQSPWESYVRSEETTPSSTVRSDDPLNDVSAVDLIDVHRYTPQILNLVKHIHLEYPNLDLGADWQMSFSDITSSAEDGSVPLVVTCGTRGAEGNEIYSRISALGPTVQAAIAIVDEKQLGQYTFIAEGLSQRGFKTKVLTSRDDVNAVQYRRRGVVLAPAEYLAGLQFETVFIGGLPEFSVGVVNQSYRRRRALSMLYVAVTRASRTIELFVNDDNGGMPHLLRTAQDRQIVRVVEGPRV